MDDHLRLESLSAATLRMLLVQERARRQELEQEVARLRAGLARQNEVILRLERENAQLRREQQELRGLEECPGCGGQLVGGWIQRRVQVIELPSEVRARVIEHQVYAHWCQRCRRRVVASPLGSKRDGSVSAASVPG